MNDNNNEIAKCFARLAELFSSQSDEPTPPTPTQPTQPAEPAITPDDIRQIVKAYRVEHIAEPILIAEHKKAVAAIAAEHGKLDELAQNALHSFRDAILNLENPFD